jgi:hypothetical protein
MIAAKYLFGLSLVLAAPGFAPSAAQADTPPLGAHNADITESSISGISSGAFTAVQFATAWSDIVKGVGIIAGSPYYCAQAVTALGGLTGADQDFTAICTVAGPSFSDAGLSPATSYAYKVTANASGNEGPASTAVTATTLPVPPRCPAPGSCPVAR